MSQEILPSDKDYQTYLAWIAGFYSLEDSYYKADSKQAFFDLGARRLVALQSKEINLQARNYWITTELNKTFVKCYRSQYLILNISVNNHCV